MDQNFLIYFGILLATIGAIVVTVALVRRFFNFFLYKKTKQLEDRAARLEKEKLSLEFSLKKTSRANEELMKMNEDYRKMFQRLSFDSTDNEELFGDLLGLALELVPEAQAGSVSLLSGKRWKYVAVNGVHDWEILKRLDLKSDWMIHTEQVEIIESIIEKNYRMPKEIFEKLSEATGATIYRSMFVPFRIDGHFAGNFCLDVLYDVKFSQNSLTLMESFGKIVSNFITLKNVESLETVNQNRLLRSIVNLHEMKNLYMRGHSERVSFLAAKIGENMKLSPMEVDTLYWAGIFHDIGKISVPDEIMRKPAKMTDEEFELMKTHPIASEKLLSGGKNMDAISSVVRHHHESFDGRGYPDGLKGKDIPLSARILAVADSFDAMMRPRPYGESLEPEEAVEKIGFLSGTKFDPEVVECSLEILKEYSKNMKARPTGNSSESYHKVLNSSMPNRL